VPCCAKHDRGKTYLSVSITTNVPGVSQAIRAIGSIPLDINFVSLWTYLHLIYLVQLCSLQIDQGSGTPSSRMCATLLKGMPSENVMLAGVKATRKLYYPYADGAPATGFYEYVPVPNVTLPETGQQAYESR
jgi:hypothetical protein